MKQEKKQRKQPLTRHTVTGDIKTPKRQLEIENPPKEATTVNEGVDQKNDWHDRSHNLDDHLTPGKERNASRDYLGTPKGKHLEPESQTMTMTADNQNALMGILQGVVSHASMKQLGLGEGNKSKER
jgi:hypothetical protein